MKKILLLFIVLLVSGCTVRYNLTINEDLSVDEEFYGLENAEFYDLYPYDTRYDVVNFMVDYDLEYLVSNSYKYEYFNEIETDLSGIKVTNKFANFNEYMNKTNTYKHYFDNLRYRDDNGIITIASDGNFTSYYYDDPVYYGIDDSVITINIPFEIVESNADSCENDGKINKCVWYFNSEMTDGSIYLEFDKNSLVHDSSLMYSIMVGIGILFIIGITCIIINVRIKTRDRV